MPTIRNLLRNLYDRGSIISNQRRQNLSAQELDVFRIVLEFLHQLFNALVLTEKCTVESYKFVEDQVKLLIESFPENWQISNQEINDIQLEMRRLRFLVRTSL